jgi:hypothetical protein
MLVVLFPVLGCREEPPSQFDRNKAPETFLTSAPAESSLTFYRVHLHWAGFDRDGYVARYQWAITDSVPDTDLLPWSTTTRTDSVFIFQVQEDAQITGRRFYVRAVDNEGRRDDTPAYTFFVARDAIFPEVLFSRALGRGRLLSPERDTTVVIRSTAEAIPTDTIPANGSVDFAWTGVDRDTIPGQRVGRVMGFRHKLNTRELDWVGGGLEDTTASYSGLSSGVHVLYVQALDEAGLATDSYVQSASRRSVVANFDPDSWFETNESGRVVFVADGTQPHVQGDTLLGGTVRRITSRVSARDRDGSIGRMQFRVDGDNWSDSSQPGDSLIEVGSGSLRDGDHVLQARGVDNLARTDGTPAELRFVIGFKPVFHTEYTMQNIPFVQYPREGGVVEVDASGSFTIKFFALDKEGGPGPVAGYAWSLDGGPFGGDDLPLSQPDAAHGVPSGGYYMTIQLPEETDDYQWEGPHTIAIRARDLGNTWGFSNNPRCEEHYNEFQERCDWAEMKDAAAIQFTVVRRAGAAAGRSMYR